jgi:DNA-binding NtrC family response regulator
MLKTEDIEILVVDDELLIRDLLYDFFSSIGYTVHLAENGQKALQLIDKVNFQVALIDLKMPEVDGLEFTSVLSEKKPFVPIVIMTAYPFIDSAIESKKKGIFDCVIKPFKIAQLSKIVSKAINEYGVRLNNHYVRPGTAYNSAVDPDVKKY